MKEILKIKKRYKLSFIKAFSLYIKYRGDIKEIKKIYDYRIVV
jgi:hypothetical protein